MLLNLEAIAPNDSRGILTHLFPITLFPPPKNIRKLHGFLIFSGGRERVHWEQRG